MINLQERLTAFAMLGATWVMWLLVVLSIICVAIILERAYFFISTKDKMEELRLRVRELLLRNKLDEAKKVLGESKSTEAQIINGALEDMKHGKVAVQERLQAETILSRARMEKNLAFLGTVGNNAPFVGLLGTVIGIIRAFQELNESAGQVSTGLMAEIGEALVATAIGLLVALPAVAFFNYFQRVVKSRLTWADAMGHDVLSFIPETSNTNHVLKESSH